jgi:hypothetical protein
MELLAQPTKKLPLAWEHAGFLRTFRNETAIVILAFLHSETPLVKRRPIIVLRNPNRQRISINTAKSYSQLALLKYLLEIQWVY